MTLLYILFAALTLWVVLRFAMSTWFALKRRHIQSIMKDLGEHNNGQ